MDAILALLGYLPSVVFGIGTVVTLLAVRRTPAGSEDEDGFHYQPQSKRSLDAREADPVLVVTDADSFSRFSLLTPRRPDRAGLVIAPPAAPP